MFGGQASPIRWNQVVASLQLFGLSRDLPSSSSPLIIPSCELVLKGKTFSLFFLTLQMIVVVFQSRDELVIGLKNGNKIVRWRFFFFLSRLFYSSWARKRLVKVEGLWLEATAQQVTNKRRFTSHGEFPPQREPNVIYNWHGKGLPTWHCGRLRWRSRKEGTTRLFSVFIYIFKKYRYV